MRTGTRALLSAFLALLCLTTPVRSQGELDELFGLLGGGADDGMGSGFLQLMDMFKAEAAASAPAARRTATSPSTASAAATGGGGTSSSGGGGGGGAGGNFADPPGLEDLFASMFESFSSSMGMAQQGPAAAPEAFPAPAASAAGSAAPASGSGSDSGGSPEDAIGSVFESLFAEFGQAFSGGGGASAAGAAAEAAAAAAPAAAAPSGTHVLPVWASFMTGMMGTDDSGFAALDMGLGDLSAVLGGGLGGMMGGMLGMGMPLPGMLGPGSSTESAGGALPPFATQMMSMLGGSMMSDPKLAGLGSLLNLAGGGSSSGLLGGLLPAPAPASRAAVAAEQARSSAVLTQLQERLDSLDSLFDFPQYTDLLSASGFNITELLEEDHPLLTKAWLLGQAIEEQYCTESHQVPSETVPTSCSGGELTLSVRSGECRILPNTTVVCSQPRVSLLRKPHWCAFKHQTAEVVKGRECKWVKRWGAVTEGYLGHGRQPPSTTSLDVSQGWQGVPELLQQAQQQLQDAREQLQESLSTLDERLEQRRQGLLQWLQEWRERRGSRSAPTAESSATNSSSTRSSSHSSHSSRRDGHKGPLAHLQERLHSGRHKSSPAAEGGGSGNSSSSSSSGSSSSGRQHKGLLGHLRERAERALERVEERAHKGPLGKLRERAEQAGTKLKDRVAAWRHRNEP